MLNKLLILLQLLLIAQYNAGGGNGDDDDEIVWKVDPGLLTDAAQYRKKINDEKIKCDKILQKLQDEKHKRQRRSDEYFNLCSASKKKQTQCFAQLNTMNQQLEELQKCIKNTMTFQMWLNVESEKLKNYPRADFQQTFKWDKCIQICITGSSRAGKSTFINTMRDIKNEKHLKASGRLIEFAAVKAGEETTLYPTEYNSDDQCLKKWGIGTSFWDLPGYGTKTFPEDKYIREMGLKYFDLVVLMTFDVFKEGDVNIMKELKTHNIPFVMVRNKLDETLQAYFEQEENLITDKESIDIIISEINNKIKTEEELNDFQTDVLAKYDKQLIYLKKANPGSENLFFISAYYENQDKYETPQLRKKMNELVMENLLERQKKDKILNEQALML